MFVKERLINALTYLQTGAGRVALLLLGSINSRGLAAGALAPRGLALSAGNCWDAMHTRARGDRVRKEVGKKVDL